MIVSLALATLLSLQDGDLVKKFLDGSDDAAAELRKRGTEAAPAILQARASNRTHARWGRLEDLHYEIKVAAADEAGKELFKKWSATELKVDFEKGKLRDVVSFYRDFTGLDLMVDPAAEEGSITIRFDLQSGRRALDRLCAEAGVDYDVRYGILWVAAPERLWGAKALPRTNAWEKTAKADDEIVRKLRGTKITLESIGDGMSLALAVDFLRESGGLDFALERGLDDRIVSFTAHGVSLAHFLALITIPIGLDVEISDGIVIVFDPSRPKAKPLAWTTQKLEGEDAALAKRLRETKLTLDLRDDTWEDFAALLKESSDVPMRFEDGLGSRKVTLAVRDLTLENILSMVLQGSADVRIEKGALVVFDPAKRK